MTEARTTTETSKEEPPYELPYKLPYTHEEQVAYAAQDARYLLAQIGGTRISKRALAKLLRPILERWNISIDDVIERLKQWGTLQARGRGYIVTMTMAHYERQRILLTIATVAQNSPFTLDQVLKRMKGAPEALREKVRNIVRELELRGYLREKDGKYYTLRPIVIPRLRNWDVRDPRDMPLRIVAASIENIAVKEALDELRGYAGMRIRKQLFREILAKIAMRRQVKVRQIAKLLERAGFVKLKNTHVLVSPTLAERAAKWAVVRYLAWHVGVGDVFDAEDIARALRDMTGDNITPWSDVAKATLEELAKAKAVERDGARYRLAPNAVPYLQKLTTARELGGIATPDMLRATTIATYVATTPEEVLIWVG